MNGKTKRNLIKALLYACCLLVLVITGFPFIFLLINSFKDMQEYLKNIWQLPSKFFFGNYKAVFKPDFLRYFINSAIVSAARWLERLPK